MQLGPGLAYLPPRELVKTPRFLAAEGSVSPSSPFLLGDEVAASSEDHCSSLEAASADHRSSSANTEHAALTMQHLDLEALFEAVWFGAPRPPTRWSLSHNSSTSALSSSPDTSLRPAKSVITAASESLAGHEPTWRTVSCGILGPSAAIDVSGKSPSRGAGPPRQATPPGYARPPLPPPVSLRTGTPVLGTWVNRQYRLLSSSPAEGEAVAALPDASPDGGRSAAYGMEGHGAAAAALVGTCGAEVADGQREGGALPQPHPHHHAPDRPPIGQDSGAEDDAARGGEIASAAAAAAAAAADVKAGAVAAMGLSAAVAVGGTKAGQELGDDEAQQAAWRWRFTRRWHAEQARVAEEGPEPRGGIDGDEVEEALEYLSAWGGGGGAAWSIAGNDSLGLPSVLRDAGSDGRVRKSGSMASMQSESMAGIEVLLGDNSPISEVLGGRLMRQRDSNDAPVLSGGAGGGAAATHEVHNMRRVAHGLLQQQAQVELLAEQRWKECMSASSDAWVGGGLAPVEVDESGTFRFLLLRIKDRYSHQRIIVRGRNIATDASLLEEVAKQMYAASTQLRLPMEAVQVMGGGTMEWRRDRASHVQVHSGFVSDAGGAGANGNKVSRGDLLSLACVLIKQSLPSQYRVTIGAT